MVNLLANILNFGQLVSNCEKNKIEMNVNGVITPENMCSQK